MIILLFSGLKINKAKCKIARISLLKGIKLALCGMECVNLNDDVIKILGICYSYETRKWKNFLNHITKLQNVLNMWRMRSFSLLGKISIFRTLVFSKIIHLTLVTSVLSSSINLLNKIQRDFLWDKKNTKIKPYVVITPIVIQKVYIYSLKLSVWNALG